MLAFFMKLVLMKLSTAYSWVRMDLFVLDTYDLK
jgi:hypothetical protein